MGDVKFEFIVRSCKYEELPKVIMINENTLPENYPSYFYEQILEKYPESFMVAELKSKPGKIVGYIMWRAERGISSFGVQLAKKGHLVSIAVLEQYRRNGVATNLLTESMKKVMEYNINEFVLEVRVSNYEAIDLYQKNFKFDKRRVIEHYYRDNEDAYYMALKSEDFKFN